MIWNPEIKSVCFTPCGFVMAKIALRSWLLPVLVNFKVLVLVFAVLEAISLTGGNMSLVVPMFFLASWLLVDVPRVADLDRTQADVDSPTSRPFAP